MQKLAQECQACLPQSLSPLHYVTVSYEMPHMKEGQKAFFGLFLVQARVVGAISQTAIAKAVGTICEISMVWRAEGKTRG